MRARKRYGQHFLEAAWVDKLVEAIDPRPGDRFVEIGPGAGALTLRLAPRVAHITAVELDAQMIAMLRPRLPPNVDLVHGDVLRVDLADMFEPGPVRVAGNLPYNVSSPIIFKLIEAHRRTRQNVSALTDATVMVQLEVAERLTAVPNTKAYGVLSILVQLHADITRVLTLPPGAFRPAPKVHSAVLRLTFRAPRVATRDLTVFEAMVRSMFTQRRKTLGNALRAFADARATSASAVLGEAGIDPGRRPETLQLSELATLADVFVSIHT